MDYKITLETPEDEAIHKIASFLQDHECVMLDDRMREVVYYLGFSYNSTLCHPLNKNCETYFTADFCDYGDLESDGEDIEEVYECEDLEDPAFYCLCEVYAAQIFEHLKDKKYEEEERLRFSSI